ARVCSRQYYAKPAQGPRASCPAKPEVPVSPTARSKAPPSWPGAHTTPYRSQKIAGRWRRAEVAPQHGRVRRRSRALQVYACQTEARISHLSWSKAYARLPLSAFRRICVSEPFNYRDFWRENRSEERRV